MRPPWREARAERAVAPPLPPPPVRALVPLLLLPTLLLLLMCGLLLFLRETRISAAMLRIPEDYLEKHREL